MALQEHIWEREQRWQNKWSAASLFEANPDSREKFFCTFPYPYVNGLPHVGHLFSIMRVEAFARYQRLQGKNVLFPQAWHATGSPIATAALRVKEKDAKQIQILKDLGVQESEISKFEEPEHWIDYFVPRYKKDLSSAGMSVDWRREFHTTSLNPQYDAFIRWQFLKLKEKNYVQKGKHPVVWCPKENTPVGDHDRLSGEGETPQEFTILKFPLADKKTFLIAATLRPETVFGQTNMWVAPDIEYVEAQVDDEVWIVSKECTAKLTDQGKKVKILGKIEGKSLLGKHCTAPGIERDMLILPSDFCDPRIGSGIVTSVPSHAPFDWIGLHDLQKDPTICKQYNLDYEEIKKIEPIGLIAVEGWGEHPGKEICEKWNIKDQKQTALLEKAKKTIYKDEHFKGVMTATAGKYGGQKVEEAKDKVKADLIAEGKADVFYEITGKVVCRCQTESIVKIVSDQWFIMYSDEEWKKQAHDAVQQLNLYPGKVRQQFDYVVDWLNRWACTREFGLGTKLPWDDQWLIESLSDSTIYMAYYTIAHMIRDVPAEHLTEAFFDHVYLGKGTKPDVPGIDVDVLRKEFLYWYPMDFRNSGKDLVQNHLTFMLFNHCAIFEKKHWPRGIGVNGWVTVNGQKMSKSLGNVIPVRQLINEYGADATRMTILNGGEGLDDPNWDSDFARGMLGKLDTFIRLAEDITKNKNGETPVDPWFRSRVEELVRDATKAMEATNFRTALQIGFFEFGQVIKWYLQRTMGKPNAKLLRKAFEKQLVMVSPFIPHACEEAWKTLGNEGFASAASWPKANEKVIDEKLELSEAMIRDVTERVRRAESPKKIALYLAADWKRDAYIEFDQAVAKTRHPGEIMKLLSATALKEHGEELSRLVKFLVKNRTSGHIPTAKEEKEWLKSASDYLSQQAGGVAVEIHDAGGTAKKANSGLPGRPAVELL